MDLRQRRMQAGLSQRDLARLSGIAQPNISSYEAGTRHPSPSTLARLMRALGPRPSQVLDRHRDEVVRIVRRHGGTSVKVFGSVARGVDDVDSDIDLLIDFRPGTTLLDIAALSEELEALLGTRVDIVSAGGLRGLAGRRIAADAVALVA